MAKFTLAVNGGKHEVEAQEEMPLLWVLRDLLGLTGTKFGCGIGVCGACTVNIDGQAMRACVTPVSAVEGAVMTIEGLSPDGSHPLQKAWVEHDVPQCGYCQAGHLMHAAALLNNNKQPSEADIDDAFATMVCRCGTHVRIKQALLSLRDGK